MKRSLATALAAVTLASSAATAQIGAPLFATSPTVTVRFAGASAGGVSDLYWFETPGSARRQFLFANGGTPVGSEITIAHTFTIGEEAVFGLDQFRTGSFLYSGLGSRNGDGLPHMQVTPIVDPTYAVRGGWEDLTGGGDQDFDDLLFDFGGVSAVPTVAPEPATLALVGGGLLGVIVAARRRRS
jgi:hypothetical protein